ncbi:copper resistance D family protein [Aquipuribacter sp. SD81]|uniref:copper resistance D family protein n=1 Tax=Aquipuribacter sp. SD81 TaxID=3127703 RepID=UPI003016D8A8
MTGSGRTGGTAPVAVTGDRSPDARRAARPPVRGLVPGLVGGAALAVLLLVGWLTDPGEVSVLDDAGPLTRALLPVARLAGELAAVAVVAGLLTCVLAPAGALRSSPARGVPGWAAGWAAVSVASALLGASDISNQPVPAVLGSGQVLDYLVIIPQARTHAVTAGLALALAATTAVLLRRDGRVGPRTALVLLVPTGVAVAYPLLTGHSASAANHQLALTSLVVHVLAALAWVGGLAGVTVHLRSSPDALVPAVARFDGLALTAFVVVAASGLLNAWVRIPDPAAWVSSAYGVLLLGKVAALLLLGVAGALHRTRTLRRLRAGEAGAFRRLAVAEVGIMGATFGLAVALSRTPTP